jgi:hypothetical protein
MKSESSIQISGLSNNGKTVLVTTIYSDGTQRISRVPKHEAFVMRYHLLNKYQTHQERFDHD